MKIETTKSALVGLLQRVSQATQAKNTMPILACCRLRTDGRLIAEATDLEISVSGSCIASIAEDGEVCVPARTMLDTVKAMPLEEVKIEKDPRGHVIVKSGKAKAKVLGLDTEEFPTMPTVGEGTKTTIPGVMFADIVDRTVYCASKDETRYNLIGVSFASRDGELHAAATDGHRMSLVRRESDVDGVDALIPSRALAVLSKYVGGQDVEVSIGEQSAQFVTSEMTLTVGLITSAFPDVDKVIPDSPAIRVVVGRKELLSAVQRVMTIADSTKDPVGVGLKSDGLHLTHHNPDSGEVSDVVHADFDCDDSEFAVCAAYLVDALKGYGCEEVEIGYTDAVSPVLVSDADDDRQLAVIMPMRL